MKLRDLLGQRFGRLVVLRRATNKYGVRWVCKCDCGQQETIVHAGNLVRGITTSCGCYRAERLCESRHKPAFAKCEKGEAAFLYTKGFSSFSIGKSLGVKADTVIRFLKSKGIATRNHKESLSASSAMGTKKGALRPEISRVLWSRRINAGGYSVIKTPKGWMQEHRFIMESLIKRSLKKNEVVHHKDGNKLNNSNSNLQLMTNGEHTKLHHLGSKRSDETKKKISEKAKQRRKV